MTLKTINIAPNTKGFYLPKASKNTLKSEREVDTLTIILPGFLDSCSHRHIVDLATNIRYISDVISFDPLGTWSNGWDGQLYNIKTYIEQAMGLIHLYGQGKAINIIGHSLGGQIAISLYDNLMKNWQYEINSIIIIETPDVIPKIAKKLYRLIPDRYFTRINPITGHKEIHRQGFDLIFDMHQRSIDNLRIISAAKCNKLFIAGELDKQVLARQVKALFDQAELPKSYILLPIHHNYLRYSKELDLVSRAIMNFWSNKPINSKQM